MARLGVLVRGFGRFWYDFIVGDDPKIAVAVAVVLVLGGVLVGVFGASGALLIVGLAAFLLLTFTVAMVVDVSVTDRKDR